MLRIVVQNQHSEYVYFNVHTALLRSQSPRFARYLEKKNNHLKDSDKCDLVFDLRTENIGNGPSHKQDWAIISFLKAQPLAPIIDWMYGVDVLWSKVYPSSGLKDSTFEFTVVNLYVLVDAFEIRRMQNQLMDVIRFATKGCGAETNLILLRFFFIMQRYESPACVFLLERFVYGLLNSSPQPTD